MPDKKDSAKKDSAKKDSAKKDSTVKTLVVALLLCVVCSVLVSTAAVALRPRQETNRTLDRKRTVLEAAGLLEPSDTRKSVEEKFGRVETRIITYATGEPAADLNVELYDPRKAAKDPATSEEIPRDKDFGDLKRRAQSGFVYLVKKDGKIESVVLPVHGKGLWGTMWGFLALERDLNTVRGLTFYEHLETPGLGGEVDNPAWKAQWPGKTAYDDATGSVAIQLIKGTVSSSTPGAHHKVDGLSGATITSRGVTNLLRYWLGSDGYGPFLDKLRVQFGGNADG